MNNDTWTACDLSVLRAVVLVVPMRKSQVALFQQAKVSCTPAGSR
jgi:hypothetical protein